MEVHLRWQAHWLLALFTVHLYRAHSQTSLHIHFTKAPPKITSQTTAAFEFAINDSSGRDSCENCSIQCKLDEEASIQDCDSRGNSYVNLLDGLHIFQVFVVASKNRFSFQYSWTVDTMPPTATLRAGSGFTNAKHVSLNIIFSEPCYPSTNSTCSGILCNLQVKGLGTVVPSTLTAIRPGLEYTVMIKLSETVLDGRVVLALAKGFCTDWAGNKFQRNENSSFVIHFDRRRVFANLWTEIPEFEVDINHQERTIRATNKPDLSINLDFSESMINTTTEILSQVTASIGKLIQTTRKTHGNRKFSFQIANVPSLAVVTIMLQTKALLSRFGNRVSVVNPVTFLFDNLRPKIKLSTISRTKTEERHARIIIQFSEPVLVFDSSDLVISGGRTSRFEEISSTIYYLEVVFIGDVLLSVLVPQNRVHDVAGNPNYASNVLRFRHCTFYIHRQMIYLRWCG